MITEPGNGIDHKLNIIKGCVNMICRLKHNKVLSFSMVMLLILLNSIFAYASAGSTQPSQPVQGELKAGTFLHTGSPLILSQGKIDSLDPNNPDVAATVVKGRTLLPLRALSEYFGAEVTFDTAKKAAVVEYKGVTYLFPVNQDHYIISNRNTKNEIGMDSRTLILNGRTMVPVRVICENILGKKVTYYDNVIAIADQEINLEKNPKLRDAVQEKIGEALKARNLDELKLALNGGTQARERTMGLSGTGAVPANMNTAQDNEAAKATASDTTPMDYTRTLTQVDGIDEADIVKTNGKYLFISGGNSIRIIGTERGKLSDDATIVLGNNKYISEIYVDRDRMVLLGTRSEYRDPPVSSVDGVKPLLETDTKRFLPPYYTKTFSFVDVYDITNPKKPIFLKEHEMEGTYQTSRKNGNIVYLVSNTFVYRDNPLPLMKDSASESKEVNLKLDDVMILPRCPSSGYIILSAVNISDESKTEVEAITAAGSTLYMNEHALYLAGGNYDNKTIIHKFNIEGMKIGYAGSGEVEGSLLNQFSMDEHDGYLRVASTTWGKGNGIYILDDSLNIAGSIGGLAKDETIYSVRFIGNKGYIVTFRNTDPLFVFDLTNPAKPKLTGELTIPGFSNYLQPVGENLILGIGADTYEIYRKDETGKDVVIGNRQGGIKLSLFDVSDMGKPKEISKYVIGDSGSYAEALYNHKAVMLDGKNQNVAFDATICNEKGDNANQTLVLMNYSNSKLTLKGTLKSEPLDTYGKYTPFARRAVAIGDVLYYIQDGRITSYRYNSLAKIDSIVLQ